MLEAYAHRRQSQRLNRDEIYYRLVNREITPTLEIA